MILRIVPEVESEDLKVTESDIVTQNVRRIDWHFDKDGGLHGAVVHWVGESSPWRVAPAYLNPLRRQWNAWKRTLETSPTGGVE